MSEEGLVIEELTVETASVSALARLFDDARGTPRSGDVLPIGWHWAALSEWPHADRDGPDGHPARTGTLAEIHQPRRMFAGGRFRIASPLIVGQRVVRETWVSTVQPKVGKKGTFTLAALEQRILHPDGELAIRETQNLIFRDAADQSESPVNSSVSMAAVERLLHRDGERFVFATDPNRLMRFSAATSNGHRIHYDAPYAVNEEGYPGLVVHGPLMTLSILEAAWLAGSRSITAVQHKNTAPLFCGEQAEIVFMGDGAELTGELTRRSDGVVNLRVEMTETTGVSDE